LAADDIKKYAPKGVF